MGYELLCLCHGKMVDTDPGKFCSMILKYGKNYDGYWTGAYVTTKLQDTL